MKFLGKNHREKAVKKGFKDDDSVGASGSRCNGEPKLLFSPVESIRAADREGRGGDHTGSHCEEMRTICSIFYSIELRIQQKGNSSTVGKTHEVKGFKPVVFFWYDI